MAINTTQKEVPTGDGNPTAGGAINTLDLLPGERDEKVSFSYPAACALKGHALYRTDAAEGPATYSAKCCGSVPYLPSIDTEQLLLSQIGGRL